MPTCHSSFHTYAVQLTEREVRWYLDGRLPFTVEATRMDTATWERATRHGFFLILNVAVGGGLPQAFGGGPTAATAPGRPMLVGHVRVLTK